MKPSRRIGWAKAAVKVAEGIPFQRMHPDVLEWISGRSHAVRAPWAVAFSGGADSLVLLLTLWASFPKKREQLVALHFDHRLRGAESRSDVAFCRSVCRELGVLFICRSWKRRTGTKVSEATAREARMAFFDEALKETGAKALWLGHQLDDVAETFFMRLARGSGLGGLCAPRPVQVISSREVRLRPLLRLRKRDLVRLLSDVGLPWREDSSNASALYLRNRIRNQVVDAWSAANPERDALLCAGISRDLLQEDDDALLAWLDVLKPLKGRKLDLGVLKGKPRALWRRALYQWLAASPYHGDLSRQGFESLLRAAMKGSLTRQSLGIKGFAVVDKGILRFSTQSR